MTSTSIVGVLQQLVPIFEELDEPLRRAWRSGTALSDQEARQIFEQQRRVLGKLLELAGMNPASLNGCSFNWLELLHAFVMSITPHVLLQLYTDTPTDDELRVLVPSTPDGVLSAETRSSLRERTLHPYRERGFLVKVAPMAHYRWLIMDPVQRIAAFAVPSKECVAAIARHGPIVECGAGTGYWSAILQHSGVDVVAYDAEPPSAESNNSFFDSTFTQVRRGHGPSLFASAEAAALCQRALLLVWPNNADVSDNRHLLGNAGLREEGVDAAPLWDADCLEGYLAAGGNRVIYVGEREEQLELLPGARPECGTSSSRRFQALLREQCRLVERVDCPRWWFDTADLTVWVRAK